MKTTTLSLIAAGMLTLSSQQSLASTQPDLIGNAYDTKTNTLIYQEKHSFEHIDGEKVMRSLFIDAQGNTLAKRTVEYQSDRVQKYYLEQAGINYEESVIRESDKIKLEERNNDKVDQKEVQTSKDVVIDAGFSDYIVRHWDELSSGKKMKFNFASIGQMDSIRLQIRRADINKTSAKKHIENTENIAMFKMTIANPILSVLIKPIEIGYYKDTKQLAYYQGISNLKDLTGKQISSVRIQYAKQTRLSTT